MAGVRDRDLRRVGPWPAGINNIVEENRLPTDEDGNRIALREAENVDLSAVGEPSRRDGYHLVVPADLGHSGFSHPLLSAALYVSHGNLHAFDIDESARDLGVSVGTSPVSYALIGTHVFFCNREVSGILAADLRYVPWAPEHPAGQPTVNLEAGFGLDPGRYQVAITFVDELGRESGSTLAVAIDVPPGHGLRLSNIAEPTEPSTVLVNVYLTKANGEVLLRQATLPAGVTEYLVAAGPQGRALETQFLVPLPPGQITRVFQGRQFVACGRELLWSPAMRYGMFNPGKNRIPFPADIDAVIPVPNAGLMVASGPKTYWLAGVDPDAFGTVVAYGAGAVPASDVEAPGTAVSAQRTDPVIVWLARDGQFVYADGGRVVPLNLRRAVVDDATRAAPLYREQAGLQQIVMGLRGASQQSLAIRDKAIAHVIYADRT